MKKDVIHRMLKLNGMKEEVERKVYKKKSINRKKL